MDIAWKEAAAQLLFPQRACVACGALTAGDGLCEACRQRLAGLPRCAHCAAFPQQEGLCPACRHSRPGFAAARAALPYEGRLRESLLQFKYQEQTWLKRPLAALLQAVFLQYYRGVAFDAVLPVPLSAQRRRARGYNQSELLSALLAKQLRLPHRNDVLLRVQDTPPLADFDGPTRRKLLRGAFAAQAVPGQTLLLVDDIYTSGATLTVGGEVLRQAGAQAVYGLTVAAYQER